MNSIAHKNYFELHINILKLIMSLSFFNMKKKRKKMEKEKKEYSFSCVVNTVVTTIKLTRPITHCHGNGKDNTAPLSFDFESFDGEKKKKHGNFGLTSGFRQCPTD